MCVLEKWEGTSDNDDFTAKLLSWLIQFVLTYSLYAMVCFASCDNKVYVAIGMKFVRTNQVKRQQWCCRKTNLQTSGFSRSRFVSKDIEGAVRMLDLICFMFPRCFDCGLKWPGPGPLTSAGQCGLPISDAPVRENPPLGTQGVDRGFSTTTSPLEGSIFTMESTKQNG